jgi:hypothetical protein
MRKIILPVVLLALTACSSPTEKPQQAENEIDAARQFIRASLDGRFDLARDYLLNDSLNNNYLDLAQRSYQKVSPADKESYKGATIVVHNTNTLNDSTTILIFSNSFKNDHDTLRVIKKENKWWVDLKYLFGHDRSDTTKAAVSEGPSKENP